MIRYPYGHMSILLIRLLRPYENIKFPYEKSNRKTDCKGKGKHLICITLLGLLLYAFYIKLENIYVHFTCTQRMHFQDQWDWFNRICSIVKSCDFSFQIFGHVFKSN